MCDLLYDDDDDDDDDVDDDKDGNNAVIGELFLGQSCAPNSSSRLPGGKTSS